MSANKETFGKTVGIVLAVCLACSVVVSSAAVGLRSLQQTNEKLDKQTNILEAAGLLGQANGDIANTYSKFVQEKYVDLATGQYVDKEQTYDMYKAARDPAQSSEVENSAGFSRRADVASVFVVKNEAGETVRYVLPVHGNGLWDLMKGFLAVDNDGQTARGLVYYQHKETPGLGGEVQNPAWKAKWDGKQLFRNGEIAIQVKKNVAADDNYAVDALSGATLTSNGVQNTLNFWLGAEGFGPFLSILKSGA